MVAKYIGINWGDLSISVELHGTIPAPCHQSTLSGTRCLLFFSILHNTLHNKHNVKNRRLEFGRCHPDNSPCAAASSPQQYNVPLQPSWPSSCFIQFRVDFAGNWLGWLSNETWSVSNCLSPGRQTAFEDAERGCDLQCSYGALSGHVNR